MIKKDQKEIKIVKCNFCKGVISNNGIEPLVCVCERNNFFHLNCYEKSGKVENIDKIVESFDKVRIKY